MKYFNRKLLFSAIALGLVSMASPLLAQQGMVDVDAPKFDDLESPEFGGNTGTKNFKPKKWLEVEVKFKIKMPRTYKEDFVDKVTVKWYVAIDDPSGGSKPVFIEKEITHVNVPVNEDIYSSVYLSPTAVKRISGRDRAGKSIVKSVGGEILVNGMASAKKDSGMFSSTGKPGWWRQISRYDKIPLLNKNETPFKSLWWDRYAQIEERR